MMAAGTAKKATLQDLQELIRKSEESRIEVRTLAGETESVWQGKEYEFDIIAISGQEFGKEGTRATGNSASITNAADFRPTDFS